MRAAVLQDIRDIRVLDIPEPKPLAEDELIIRVKAVGVCGSDLHSYLEGGTTGPTQVRPFVLGHEFSGVLTPDSARKAGFSADALVAVDPSIPCGRCEWCHRGHTNLCPNVKFLGYAPHNGAMAEFVCVPRSAVHLVPDSIDPAGGGDPGDAWRRDPCDGSGAPAASGKRGRARLRAGGIAARATGAACR
ncbi:threonine dehydrogenase-like Zn-dependent dehydrogenase [Bradyrhizobium ottawaense]|uniref:alcohol dehydrogenase catalytic domain-containing protein n=1 Tax=Bradyrhizobium ottawaense TaxID=931866 RepID=UPI00351605FE